MQMKSKTDSYKQRTFEDVADRFAIGIYGKPKGQLRFNLLWRDLQERLLPRLPPHPRVLDIGGGVGHMAVRLAKHGCDVTLLEPSSSMLAEATAYFEQQAVEVRCVQGDVSTDVDLGRFDLLVCHAVLEWVDDAEGFLSALKSWVLPNGLLSLAYYNRNGIIMRNLVRGNLRKVQSNEFAGDSGSLTPTNPIDPTWVSDRMGEMSWTHQGRRGIRVFYDYMPTQRQAALPLDDVERLEWRFGGMEPWKDLGRYVHDLFVCA